MSFADLEREAAVSRDLAALARRLVRELSQATDKERLMRFAEEEDEKAARMEAEAAELQSIKPDGPIVAQQQPEQQQQGNVPPGTPKPKSST